MNSPDKTDPLEKIPSLMDHWKARDLASSLKKEDPEWDYKVVPFNKKFSLIEVFDETGHLVGKL